MSKLLLETKVCTYCNHKFTEVPDNARRDNELDCWFFECGCKSTMCVPDKRVDFSDWQVQCGCVDCYNNIDANCTDQQKLDGRCPCIGCRENEVDQADWYKDCEMNR